MKITNSSILTTHDMIEASDQEIKRFDHMLDRFEREQPHRPQIESVRRIVVAAIGWILLLFICKFLIGFIVGFIGALIHATSSSTEQIIEYASDFSDVGLLSAAALVRGRIVGFGNISVGLGNKPISKQPVIICLAVIVAAYAILVHFVVPDTKLDPNLIRMHYWQASFEFLLTVVVAPFVEESMFRGWLWTGLQRHWSILPTALLTGLLWVAMHLFDPLQSIVLIPVAIILATARYFGQSVRAPLALHMTYNFVIVSARWFLST